MQKGNSKDRKLRKQLFKLRLTDGYTVCRVVQFVTFGPIFAPGRASRDAHPGNNLD
jgi:hypothetical protein